MKNRAILVLAALTVISLIADAGPLTPPNGPITSTPGPEPRTPVNAANTPGDADSVFKIVQPGSYYLTGNLTGTSGKAGLEIAASGVSVDLMGFEVAGVVGALNGVRLTLGPAANIAVRNGTIRDWPQGGIDAGPEDEAGPYNSRFSDLRLSNNGPYGIRANRATIEYCSASGHSIGFRVFRSVVSNCVGIANACNFSAHSSTITACRADFGEIGIELQGEFNGVGQTGCVASDNVVEHATVAGIRMRRNCHVIRNTVNSCRGTQSGTGAGIEVVGTSSDGCCIIESNSVFNCGEVGIRLLPNGASILIGNHGHNNSPSGTVNFITPPGNGWGPIIDARNGGAWGVIQSANPWANFGS